MLLLHLVVIALVATTVSICLAAASEQDDTPPDFAGFGGNKPCPDFRCTSGMVPVPKSRQKFTSTGCSAMGSGMVMMGGNQGENEKVYESCCHQWHGCYQVCGVSKKVCDESFKTCTADVCGEDEDCKKDASIASLMIDIGGCQRFDQAQYGACECVDKSKTQAKREAAIRRFYKKNAPEQEDKAEGLAKKADSKGALASLFRKLLAKYPTAIEKIEDPQQAMYRRMMEDAQKKSDDAEEATEEVAEEEEEVQEL